jgi:hypothetical protein
VAACPKLMEADIRLPESDSRFVNVGTDMVTFRWP